MLILFVAITGKAQEKNHFSLFTDRDLYASGETMLIKVYVPVDEPSGIVNIDLLNTKGRIISGISKKITDHQADGFIYLPDSLSSGCYLICTSTKVNSSLTFKELYVSNRFTGIPEAGSPIRPSRIQPLVNKQVDQVGIEGLDKTLKAREKVEVSLHLPADIISQINGNLFVSISKVTPGFTSQSFPGTIQRDNIKVIEKEGVVLDGYLKDLKTGEPFKNGIVYLSIPDSIPRFDFFITGKDGYFNFQLDKYYGKLPLVVQGFDKEDKHLLKITVNHRDSLKNCLPAFESWEISPELRKSADECTDAVTFRKIFNQPEVAVQPTLKPGTDPYPFFGVPNIVVDPQLFINLPDFTEISRELLTGVKYRAYNRIPSLQVFNSAQRTYFNDSPLLLIDGIPVRDLSLIKDLGSKDLAKVEISMNERYYGNLKFPGVLAIHTKKADYSRVVVSDEVLKLNFDCIQPDVALSAPSEKLSNEPDLRKVLLWNPSLKPEQTIKLGFGTSDLLGKYKLVICGAARDGSIFYKERLFEVN